MTALEYEYLTISEVAELLRTTRSALHSQRYRSEPPGSLGRLVGRRVLWRRADLDRWWEQTAKAAR